jgi:hypothetical protein
LRIFVLKYEIKFSRKADDNRLIEQALWASQLEKHGQILLEGFDLVYILIQGFWKIAKFIAKIAQKGNLVLVSCKPAPKRI